MATTPNPRRVEAGRVNQLKRKGWTPQGLARLRLFALANQPWLYSTGPRTPEGKAVVANNGRVRQKGPTSIRQMRAEVSDVRALMADMRETRNTLEKLDQFNH